VKRFGKYRRKLWKDMKNIENMEEQYFFFYKTINTACNLFKFTLCPRVRGELCIWRDNSVIGDITLYVENKLQLCMCKDNIKVRGITLYVEV
jgi:hypothetical protein